MLIRIDPSEAMIGMYVESFEGSWLKHPFWRARFVLQTQEEVEQIKAAGAGVFIDSSKGTIPASDPRDEKPAVRPAAKAAFRRASRDIILPPAPSHPVKRIAATATFGKADRARAAIVANRSAHAVAKLFDDCQAGRGLSITVALEIVDDIARSIEHNQAAFNTVTRLKSKDNATYMHSVAVSGLMIGFARELALSTEEVNLYGLAGLEHDVGKLFIDRDILQKEGPLTDDEMTEVRRHPQLGHSLLVSENKAIPIMLDVCLHHHERMDGSGYPFGLAGDQITRAARVAAICDVYDALVSVRPYKTGMPGNDAIAMMEGMEGHFDPNLLFMFMRSAGFFPAGKLLKLRSNRLAVVLPGVQGSRHPLVRAFYSTAESRFIDYEDAILSNRLSDDQAITQEVAGEWFDADWKMMTQQIYAGRYPAIHSASKP